MSFSRIKNPKKRDDEVKRYLALKESFRMKDRMEKTGEFGRAEELSKIFKPVTTASSKLEEALSKQIKDIPGAIAKALPAFSPVPAIEGVKPAIEEEGAVGEEEKTEKYLIPGEPSLSYHLNEINKNRNDLKGIFDLNTFPDGSYTLNFNNHPLGFDEKYVYYKGEKYKKTNELLELLFSSEVKDEDKYDPLDLESFYSIVMDSEILPVLQVRGGKKGKTIEFYSPNKKFIQNKFIKPKWKLLKPVWEDTIKPMMDASLKSESQPKTPRKSPMIKRQEAISQETKRIMEQQGARPKTATRVERSTETDGSGLKRRKNKNVVFLSSNPETLVDRLTLLCSSAQAGNTGLKNEMVEICNELIRKKVITRRQKDELLNDI